VNSSLLERCIYVALGIAVSLCWLALFGHFCCTFAP